METDNRTFWSTAFEQHDSTLRAYVSDDGCCTRNPTVVCILLKLIYGLTELKVFHWISSRFPQILAYYSDKTTLPLTLCQVIALGRSTELAGLNNSLPNA